MLAHVAQKIFNKSTILLRTVGGSVRGTFRLYQDCVSAHLRGSFEGSSLVRKKYVQNYF
jgi:hypothetical protein